MSDGRLEEMKRLYRDEGLTYAQIGDRYGLTRQRIQQMLAPFGLGARSTKRRRDEREALIRAAHRRIKAGESTLEEESEALGYKTSESLRVALWRLGLRKKSAKKKVPAHGTYERYREHSCRCKRCRDADRERRRLMVERGPAEHGTASAYRNYGCRCPLCRQAAREYAQELKRRKEAA